MGLLQQFEMLSESEKLFVASNPYSAPVIRFSADEATQKTIQIFGHNGHNDMSDAFRHCYFAALLSRDLGYYDALDYLNAHERFPNNPREEKRRTWQITMLVRISDKHKDQIMSLQSCA
ncbi:DUF6973 domain-containing protein [Hafnia alvei]|uniref:DUF6973 domain-containing protein n=1 Tax=Hafnia alvei TaxID=569 RepID=A0ABD7Q2U3_HAFAL|nr:hypothetical protein [Hafnia alvei]TBL65447.1 hypothetical protein EYY96_20775 [Hafnia alvei]